MRSRAGGVEGGSGYYIIAGRQVNWKRFDLAVEACGKLGEKLLIVGDGPEHSKLVNLAKRFTGQNERTLSNDNNTASLADSSDDQLSCGCGDWRDLLGNKPATIIGNFAFLPKYNGVEEIAQYFRCAKGFIFPSLEPFGIVPVEALACGLPILAYAHGGSTDIVEEGVNGLFFKKQTVDSLANGIQRFNVAQFDRKKVAKTAERFNENEFDQRIKQVIKKNIEVGRG